MAPLFIRKSRRGDWDAIKEDTPADLTFPANVLSDILDSENEISVWEVSDPPKPEELDRIVAALHARNVNNLTDVTFRLISGWRVKTKLGLKMKTTVGLSLDSQLNNAGKHQVIEINSVGDAIELAKAFKGKDPIFYSRDQVMYAMAAALAYGRIQSDAIGPGLVKKLFDGRHIQLSLPQSQAATTT
ncbi:hypothetical protein [Bradyrhizobium sp.]|uniref:hypothetical protein n=1 Tax=Bradyrhizobium sp. TaxID=376 RepID=UPI0039E3D92F